MTTDSISANASAPVAWWQDVLILLLLGAVVLFPDLGQTARWSSHEDRHAEIAREMAQTGDYLIPRLLGQVYPDKPPTMHALVAGLYRLTGEPSMGQARLPSAVAGVIGILLTYLLGRWYAGRELGLLAGGCLAATAGYVNWARIVRPDMLFATLILATAVALYGAVRCDRTGLRAVGWVVAGLGAALAVITKGPYGIIFPAIFLVLATWRQPHLRRPRAAEYALLAGALLLGVGGWAGALYVRDGGAYLHAVIFQPDLTSGGGSSHARALYYYLGPLLSYGLPLALFLPFAAIRWRRVGYSPMLATTVAIFVILSVVPGKRPHYLEPIYPFLSLATAEGLLYFGQQRPGVLTAARRLVLALVVGNFLYYHAYLALAPPKGNAVPVVAEATLAVVPPGGRIICYQTIPEGLAFLGRDEQRVTDAATVEAMVAAATAEPRPSYLVVEVGGAAALEQALPPNTWRRLREFAPDKKDGIILYRVRAHAAAPARPLP